MIPYLLESHPFNLPTCWEDVTTRQWFQLKEVDMDAPAVQCELLSILSGLDRDLWFNTDKIDVVEKLLPMLDWMKSPADLSKYPVPAKVTLKGKEVEIPKDIRLKTFGAKITFQNELSKYLDDKGDARIEFLPVNLSIYLCEEPFNDEKAKGLIDDIGLIPITQTYPTAAFFLNNFLTSFSLNTNT